MINDLIGNLGTVLSNVASLFGTVITRASDVIGVLSSNVF